MYNLSTTAKARKLLSTYAGVKPLSKAESARIALALKNSGVKQATTRIAATFSKLVLKEVI